MDQSAPQNNSPPPVMLISSNVTCRSVLWWKCSVS